MKQSVKVIFDELFCRYPALSSIKEKIGEAFETLRRSYENGGKLLICGNGGSCADAEHIAGELDKSFKMKRAVGADLKERLNAYGERGRLLSECLEGTLPAIALTSHPALSSAYANDRIPAAGFAQQVVAFGKAGDALIAITTSGNSENCLLAAIAAKASGLSVVALTGKGMGKIAEYADITINVPETETFKVQEYHLPVYHALCAMLEAEFFS